MLISLLTYLIQWPIQPPQVRNLGISISWSCQLSFSSGCWLINLMVAQYPEASTLSLKTDSLFPPCPVKILEPRD